MNERSPEQQKPIIAISQRVNSPLIVNGGGGAPESRLGRQCALRGSAIRFASLNQTLRAITIFVAQRDAPPESKQMRLRGAAFACQKWVSRTHDAKDAIGQLNSKNKFRVTALRG